MKILKKIWIWIVVVIAGGIVLAATMGNGQEPPEAPLGKPAITGVEFLIYDKDHWMDNLSVQELKDYIDSEKITQQEYDGRYQRGDVVEISPAGFYTKTLKGDLSRWGFRVVAVSGISINDAQHYMDSSTTKRRRYNFSTGAGKKLEVINNINDVLIIDKGQ